MSEQSKNRVSIPLFPLRTVLFPGGPLPLRVFEPRYLDMISRCLREDGGFGVVLIKKGAETGPAEFVDIGTIAKVSDWYQGSDGILGVTATGERRFRVLTTERQSDGLNIATIDVLDAEASLPLPDEYQFLADILKGVLDDFGRLYEGLEKRYDDANWVSCRLAEILPIAAENRQRCLEIDDAMGRLAVVAEMVSSVRGAS